MIILGFAGILLGAMSILLICFPKFAKEINNSSRKIIFTDSELFSAPKLAGLFFLISGVLLFFISKKLVFYDRHQNLDFFIDINIISIILFFFSGLSAVIGILFILKPVVLLRFFEIIHKVIFTDDFLWTSPKLFGLIFAVISAVIIYIGFHYKV